MSSINSVTCDGGSTVSVGPGVTWSTNIFGTASSCSVNGGTLFLCEAPATLSLSTGSQVALNGDSVTFPSITAQGGSTITSLAGGTITSLTLTTGSTLDKSLDNRTLTITNSTIDGDSCVINDPLNAISFTNPTSVKQRVSSGPFIFTGTRTVRVL